MILTDLYVPRLQLRLVSKPNSHQISGGYTTHTHTDQSSPAGGSWEGGHCSNLRVQSKINKKRRDEGGGEDQGDVARHQDPSGATGAVIGARPHVRRRRGGDIVRRRSVGAIPSRVQRSRHFHQFVWGLPFPLGSPVSLGPQGSAQVGEEGERHEKVIKDYS